MSSLLKKRSREDEGQAQAQAQVFPLDSSNKGREEAKRFHGETEQLFHLLEEDFESADKNHEEEEGAPSEELLSGVMRSLEEEIGVTCSTSYKESVSSGLSRDDSVASDITSDFGVAPEVDLGYLLGASYDELGIPPSPVLNVEDQLAPFSLKEDALNNEGEGFNGPPTSLELAENPDLRGLGSDNWHFEDDFADYRHLDVFGDASALDLFNQGAFGDVDYATPWRLEAAGGMY